MVLFDMQGAHTFAMAPAICCRPFDPTNYDDDYEDDIVDEVGRKRVKLKFANALRWRYKR